MGRCDKYYKLYPNLRERIMYYISKYRYLSYDKLRDLLEDEGIYMDGRCLRIYIANLIREGVLIKKPFEKINKLLLTKNS